MESEMAIAEIPIRKFESKSEMVERFCEKHGPYIAKRIIMLGRGEGIVSNCPQCDEEREALEEAKKKPSGSVSDTDRYRYAQMNIEPEFYTATLENYHAHTKSQQEALTACFALITKKQGEVLITGSNGVGKTHLACAVAKELKGAVYTMYEISCRIRHTYTTRAVESELEAVKKLSSLPFLAIDEVGRTKGGDAEKGWLSYIIDKRHTRSLPTMLLSNRPLERSLPKEKAQYSLESFLDSDIVSRFRGGAIIEIDGQDARRR